MSTALFEQWVLLNMEKRMEKIKGFVFKKSEFSDFYSRFTEQTGSIPTKAKCYYEGKRASEEIFKDIIKELEIKIVNLESSRRSLIGIIESNSRT